MNFLAVSLISSVSTNVPGARQPFCKMRRIRHPRTHYQNLVLLLQRVGGKHRERAYGVLLSHSPFAPWRRKRHSAIHSSGLSGLLHMRRLRPAHRLLARPNSSLERGCKVRRMRLPKKLTVFHHSPSVFFRGLQDDGGLLLSSCLA